MTPEEAAKEMQEIFDFHADDRESYHGRADELVSKILREAGYSKAADLYDAMEFWYA